MIHSTVFWVSHHVELVYIIDVSDEILSVEETSDTIYVTSILSHHIELLEISDVSEKLSFPITQM